MLEPAARPPSTGAATCSLQADQWIQVSTSLARVSEMHSCTRRTAIEPSPTADATRDGVVCQKVGTTRSCCWPATAGNVTGADFVIDGGMVTTL